MLEMNGKELSDKLSEQFLFQDTLLIILLIKVLLVMIFSVFKSRLQKKSY